MNLLEIIDVEIVRRQKVHQLNRRLTLVRQEQLQNHVHLLGDESMVVVAHERARLLARLHNLI